MEIILVHSRHNIQLIENWEENKSELNLLRSLQLLDQNIRNSRILLLYYHIISSKNKKTITIYHFKKKNKPLVSFWWLVSFLNCFAPAVTFGFVFVASSLFLSPVQIYLLNSLKNFTNFFTIENHCLRKSYNL